MIGHRNLEELSFRAWDLKNRTPDHTALPRSAVTDTVNAVQTVVLNEMAGHRSGFVELIFQGAQRRAFERWVHERSDRLRADAIGPGGMVATADFFAVPPPSSLRERLRRFVFERLFGHWQRFLKIEITDGRGSELARHVTPPLRFVDGRNVEIEGGRIGFRRRLRRMWLAGCARLHGALRPDMLAEMIDTVTSFPSLEETCRNLDVFTRTLARYGIDASVAPEFLRRAGRASYSTAEVCSAAENATAVERLILLFAWCLSNVADLPVGMAVRLDRAISAMPFARELIDGIVRMDEEGIEEAPETRSALRMLRAFLTESAPFDMVLRPFVRPETGTATADAPTAPEISCMDPAVCGRDFTVVIAGRVRVSALARALAGARSIRFVAMPGASVGGFSVETLRDLTGCAVIEAIDAAPDLVVQYGPHDDALSAATGGLAATIRRSVQALLSPRETSAGLIDRLPTLDLAIDDILFTHVRPYWGAVMVAASDPMRTPVLAADAAADAADLITLIRAAGQLDRLLVAEHAMSDWHYDDIDPVERDVFGHLLIDEAGASRRIAREFSALFAQGRLEAPRDLPRGAGLVIGRYDNRNYKVDLQEYGTALRRRRPVVYMPGAPPRGLQAGKEAATCPWADKVVLQPILAWRRDQRIRAPMSAAWLFESVMGSIARGAGDDLARALWSISYKQLQTYLGGQILSQIFILGIVAELIEKNRFHHLMVMPGRDWIARAACKEARAVGLPSFDMQTVFVGPRRRYVRTVADRQLVIETNSRKLFLEYFGMKEEQILLSGCAKITEMRRTIAATDRKEARRRLGMGGEPFLLFAASPLLEGCAPVAEALAGFAGERSRFTLGFRLHPSSDAAQVEFYGALAGGRPNVRILEGFGLAETLAAADVVVTRFSNVGLEGALAGRDVIACNFSDTPAVIRLDTMGVATPVSAPKELGPVIDDILEHGPIWRRLQETRAAYVDENRQLMVDDLGPTLVELVEQEAEALRRAELSHPA